MVNKNGFIQDTLGNKVFPETIAPQVYTKADGTRTLEDELTRIGTAETAIDGLQSDVEGLQTAVGNVYTKTEADALLDGKQDSLGFTPEDAAKKNQANGYAGLDANKKLALEQVPDLLLHNKGWFATEAALTAAYESATDGDYAIVGSTDTVWVWDGDKNEWKDTHSGGFVTTVNGQSGDVILTKSDVQLGNVDNTSDMDKPVSTAQQAALDGKVNSSLVGVANGVANLDASGKVPMEKLPDAVTQYIVSGNSSYTF